MSEATGAALEDRDDICGQWERHQYASDYEHPIELKLGFQGHPNRTQSNKPHAQSPKNEAIRASEREYRGNREDYDEWIR
jgi:hypothetical protein